MATAAAASQFTGVDFLGFDTLLSEEERAVRDTVRTWVDENLIPVIGDAYIEGRLALLEKYNLKVCAISNHLKGQAVCDDPIDFRHEAIVGSRVWGDGDAEGVRQRAAKEVADTARAAAKFGVGIVNGFITTVGRINPLVGTLASSIIIQGVALVLTSGLLVNVSTPGFTSLGQGTIFTLHYSVIVWGVFALVCGFLLWRTKYGRYIYASGGNAEAARLSGVRVNLIRGSAYAISGLSAGIAGVIVASRVATGDASTGTFPLAVIAGIVIGGTSILGGQGAVWRSVLGILLLALIGNGFNLLGVNPIYQQILQGSIILTAVAVDAWARKTSV